MGDKKRQKRTDIQALRAIAVLSVVVYHLWPHRLVGGFMGVDIFFVISGYLMTITLMRDAESVTLAKDKVRSGWHYLVNFYARRIKRLVPAASATLLGTLILTMLSGSFDVVVDTAKQIYSSALFFQNWQLASEAVDYLSASDPPTAVQHFWSLSLEEQFYFVWPLLLLVFLFLTINLSIVYKKTKTLGAILPTVILVAIFFMYGYQLTKVDAATAYFDTFARVWELLLGGAIAFLPKLRSYDLKLILPWLGLAMNAYALWRWNGDNFPGWHALIPVIGTALIIYGGTGSAESKLSFSNLFRFKPIQWVGDISYSLYLWHWPFIILLPMILGIYIDGPKGTMLKIWIVAISFIVAFLSYRYIEIPAQKLRLKKRYVYISFFVIISVVAGLSQFVRNTTKDSVDSQLDIVHAIVGPNSADKCAGAKWLVNKDVCENGFGKINAAHMKISNLDSYLKLTDGKKCSYYHLGEKGHQNPSYFCAVGDVDSKYQITVVGDSHAAHWSNTFNTIGKRNHIRFIIMDNRFCGTIDITKPGCAKRLKGIKKLGLFDDSKFIIFSALHRIDQSYYEKYGSIGIPLQAMRTITSTPVYLLEDNPLTSEPFGTNCIIYNTSCKLERDKALHDIKDISQKIVNDGIIKKSHIIPTDDMFCDDKFCYSSIGGIGVYFNNHVFKLSTNAHITASYAQSLSLPLEQKLRDYHILPDKQKP